MSRKAPCIMRGFNLEMLITIHPLTHPRMCERRSLSFSDMIRLKFVSTTRASFLRMPSTERENGENFPIIRGNSYHVYLYFSYPNKPGAYPLPTFSKCPCMILQIWRLLWRHPGFLVIHKWGFHVLSSICAPPSVCPFLICCGSGGWGVYCVRSERGGLLELGRGSHHDFFCTCNNDSSIPEAKSVTYVEGLRWAIKK